MIKRIAAVFLYLAY